LSEQEFRSYATYENMIDHIVSNELAGLYHGSARVHYNSFHQIHKTASDHFPVSVRLQQLAFLH
jgi:endonuclease/exonuclease/phosphatase family metal-dependent hydrolase